jgi:hypothetical protein
MIFGKEIGMAKFKTVRRKPLPAAADYIRIPEERIYNHCRVTLFIDIIKINGLTFLTTVSRKILHKTTEYIPRINVQCYRSALDTVFQIYKKGGFIITTIHCDNEFQPIMKPMEKIYGVKMNYANPQEHAPEKEQCIRVIPKIMIKK